MELVWFAVIGVFAGYLAGRIIKGRSFGLVGDLIVGVLGALLGGFVFGQLGIHAAGLLGRLVLATAGAVGLLYLLRFVKR
jgi:uncharacterized membrane protein YeaQ/YmgE (transglycosylase-associated protein family)